MSSSQSLKQVPFDCALSFSASVQSFGEEILLNVPEDMRSSLKWEHVGSTSIKVFIFIFTKIWYALILFSRTCRVPRTLTPSWSSPSSRPPDLSSRPFWTAGTTLDPLLPWTIRTFGGLRTLKTVQFIEQFPLAKDAVASQDYKNTQPLKC